MKKEYKAPKMKAVELKRTNPLLGSSYHGPVSYNSTPADPQG